VASPAQELVLYLGLGQSLLALVPRLRPLGERPGPVDPVRAWVFGGEGDPRVASDPTQDLPDDALGEPVAHLRHGRSGPLTAASAAILGALGPADMLVTVNLARRNTPIDHFLPGTAAFRNVERCIARAAGIAAARGLRFRRLVVSWVQGQADARTPHRVYLQRLGALVDGLETALRAATDGRGRLVFCLSQATAFYEAGRRGVPLAQLELAEARAGQVILAGPEYMLERSDGVHLKPRGAVRLGTLHGRAIRRALTGEGWEPLCMAEARVVGAEVRVRFKGGLGDLQAAGVAAGPVEVGVRALEHLGFVWHPPRGLTTRIVMARVSGPREVLLTLSEPPPHLEKTLLGLGFPDGIALPEGFVGGDPATARGAATALRTTGGDPGPFGEILQDWALQQRIAPRWSETA
jgi:hypothetical protein